MTRALITLFLCLAVPGCYCNERAKRGADFYTTVEVNGDTCLYVSNDPIWPFASSGTPSLAEEECQKMGLSLAVISNEDENVALQELARCKMSIPESETILIGLSTDFYSGDPAGRNCFFQSYDGSQKASVVSNCVEDWTPSDPSKKHGKVHYVCKKDSPCEQIADCVVLPSSPTSCFKTFKETGTFSTAVSTCNALQALMPRPTTAEIADQLVKELKPKEGLWVGLRTSVDPPKVDCNSFNQCLLSSDGWFWMGGGSMPALPLAPSHGQAVKSFACDEKSGCVRLTNFKYLSDRDCGYKYDIACEISFGSPGLGSSIVTPHYVSGGMTCGEIPTPPAESKMEPDSDQPALMCQGVKAKYKCNAGGINVRLDKPTMSTYEVSCKADQTYSIPTNWPRCVDFLPCKAPTIDSSIMENNFTPSSGTDPPFTVDYNCLWPNKKVVSIKDLSKGLDNSVTDVLTISCQMNGTYDKNIDEYTCSKVCPLPSNPNPDIIEHDWPDMKVKPEIYQTVTHKCIEPGKQLVSKAAFALGVANKFFDEIMSMCMVTGWLNETIGSFTCTKDCIAPYNYSEVLNYDWTEGSPTTIGAKVHYECLDNRRKIVNLNEKQSPLYEVLEVTCLFNGEWSHVISDHSCTECLRRNDPPNGKIFCESKTYALGSVCHLTCDPGFIPVDQVMTTCTIDKRTHDFAWDVDDSSLMCIEAVSLVIGGIKEDYEYTDEVEIFAPDLSCISRQLTPYPFQVVGAVSGFTRGLAIVCGGGTMNYVDCVKHPEGSNFCDRDIECVTTTGGARWCTGPKTGNCYSYDPYLTKDWSYVLSLRTPRAYAASAVLPNGELWISGGAGKSAILKTIEIIYVKKGLWIKKAGPTMPKSLVGHCMAPLNSKQIIFAGGYSQDDDDYTDRVDIYNLHDSTWMRKPWNYLKTGPRFDGSCMSTRISDDQFRVIYVGGWSNKALKESLLFDTRSYKWEVMGKNSTDGAFTDALDYKVRSGALVQLNKNPYLVGGVICSGNDNGKLACKRTNKVSRLSIENTDEPTEAYWTEVPNSAISKAVSSHNILMVPKTYAALKCKIV